METRAIMKIKGLESPIEMELKDREDIEDCPEGIVIIINDYVGRFRGVYDRTVKLESITSKMSIGFDLHGFKQYWQQI